jgi:hypothetical protein
MHVGKKVAHLFHADHFESYSTNLSIYSHFDIELKKKLRQNDDMLINSSNTCRFTTVFTISNLCTAQDKRPVILTYKYKVYIKLRSSPTQPYQEGNLNLWPFCYEANTLTLDYLNRSLGSPAWRSGYSGGGKIWWSLCGGFESHRRTWVPVFRMRLYKPRSRVARKRVLNIGLNLQPCER